MAQISIHCYPTTSFLQLNLAYIKRILHLVPVKIITFKSSYNSLFKYWHSSAAPAADCQLLVYSAIFMVTSTTIFIQGVFFNCSSQIFSTKIKNNGQPIRDSVPWNSQFTKDPRWLNNVFLFSTEIWAEHFKKNTLYHPQLYIQKAVTSAPLLRSIFCRKQQYRYRYSTVQIRFLSAAIKRQVELDSNSVFGNWYICTADSRIKVEIYLGTLVNSVFCKVFQ